jgi:hypothetical protein
MRDSRDKEICSRWAGEWRGDSIGGEDMTTVKEDILQVIDKYQSKIGEYDGPFELTYTGLGLAISRDRQVVSAVLSKLMRQGVLIYALRHVPGAARRRRVYLRPDAALMADKKKSDWKQLHSELQQINSRLYTLQGTVERLGNIRVDSTHTH